MPSDTAGAGSRGSLVAASRAADATADETADTAPAAEAWEPLRSDTGDSYGALIAVPHSQQRPVDSAPARQPPEAEAAPAACAAERQPTPTAPPRTGSSGDVATPLSVASGGRESCYCRDEQLFVSRVDEEYLCSIGHGVLVKPVMTPCQHEFCERCIQEALGHKAECPLCRGPVAQEDLRLAYKTTTLVAKLQAYCDNKAAGCTWQGKLGSLKDHRESCEFEGMRCPHLGCTAGLIPRRGLAEHMRVCAFRPVVCQYCNKQVPGCEVQEHQQVCPLVPVACPQKCSDPGITRELLENHIKHNCPLTVVQCPFAASGCDSTRFARKDLADHLQAFTAQHLLLLCQTVQSQTQKIEQQQATIQRLLRRTLIVVDQSGRGTFQTIAEGIENAEPGDRIVIRKGVYKECLVVSKSVQLEAAEPNEVTIENGSDSNVLVLRAPCRLHGLRLRQRSKNFFCIRILQAEEDAVVEHCDVQSDHFSCVQIDSGANPQIRHCKIHDSRQCGILVKRNGRGRIESNEIYCNSLSNVYIDAHAAPSVVRNRIRDSQQHGIWVKQAGAGVITNNTIYNNLMSQIKAEDGSVPQIKKNTFTQ